MLPHFLIAFTLIFGIHADDIVENNTTSSSLKFHDLNGDAYRSIMRHLPVADRPKLLTIPRVSNHIHEDAPYLFYRKYGCKRALSKLLEFNKPNQFRRAVIRLMPVRHLYYLINSAARRHDWKMVAFMLNNGASPLLLKYSIRRAVLHQRDSDIQHLSALLRGRLHADENDQLFNHPLNISRFRAINRYNWASNMNVVALNRLINFGHLELYRLSTPNLTVITNQPIPPQLDDFLMHATIYGNTFSIENLLNVGADVEYGAMVAGQRNNIDNPIYSGHRTTPLITAARMGYVDVVWMLAECGADLNVRDTHGRTALMHAVIKQRHEVINALVELGADLDLRDGSMTALMYAIHRGDFRLAKVLIEGGANLNIADNFGETALNYYAAKNDVQMIEELVRRGGRGPLNGYHSPLTVAIRYGTAETVRLVASTVAFTLDFYDPFGWTPLIYAVWHNSSAKVEALIECGADVNMQSKDKAYTPLTIAIKNENIEIIQILLAHRAKASSRDGHWKNAWDYAREGGNQKILKLLWDTKLPYVPKRIGRWLGYLKSK